jgi:hypothetical protein
MAYAAIANVGLVLLLAAITTYYAWHAKRQADASHQEVAASKRQADINTALARPEVAGVIIAHGTDTLEETAYWLDLTLIPTSQWS